MKIFPTVSACGSSILHDLKPSHSFPCVVICRWGYRTRNRKTIKVTQKWLKNYSTAEKWLKFWPFFPLKFWPFFPEKSHFCSHFWVTFPGPWKVIFESPKMSFLGPGSVVQQCFTILVLWGFCKGNAIDLHTCSVRLNCWTDHSFQLLIWTLLGFQSRASAKDCCGGQSLLWRGTHTCTRTCARTCTHTHTPLNATDHTPLYIHRCVLESS